MVSEWEIQVVLLCWMFYVGFQVKVLPDIFIKKQPIDWEQWFPSFSGFGKCILIWITVAPFVVQ